MAAVAAAPALAPAQTQKKPPAAQTAPKPAAAPQAQPGPQTLPAPKQLGSFDAWTSVELAQASNKICYMFARPVASDPKGVKRSDVMLTVTHRPTAKRYDEVSFQSGYPFKQGTPVTVDVDGKKFEFFTRTDVDAEAAWAKDDASDKAVVAAMKNGKTLKVRGTSTRNTETADTFNLAGFGKAYAEIGKACAAK
ncbi:MAG TPA: invasion associated locus B family protein [Alphaproteobacteria bacterium]